jgi:chemotaxis signal transduction protein
VRAPWSPWGSVTVMAETEAGRAGLVVRVAGTRWVMPFSEVIEVLRSPRMARLPGITPAAVGVINHRGRVLTVTDPIRALDLPGPGASGGDVVVVERGGRRFGVVVDGVVELAAGSRLGMDTLDLGAVAVAVFGEPS